MEAIKKRFLRPNHTEMAYREAVSKLKFLLAESYAPRIAFAKPIATSKRGCKEDVHTEEYGDDLDVQSVKSDVSKREPLTRIKYCASRVNHFPIGQLYSSGGDSLALPPTELSIFIERQEEYIEQLEKESQYCREELKNLVEKVKEVVAENEALQDKNKSGFFKTVLDNCAAENASTEEPRSSRRSTSSKPLEGPSIVFESRISELEAQLTQARLELRKAREENQENLVRLTERKDEPQLHLELERALREKRELVAKGEELRRELGKIRARDADVELRSKHAAEVAQQAEFEKVQAENEVRRLKDELEKRQEKLREALQDTSRRLIEEKQQVERRFSQQMEQLSADVASHWEAASKSHLESEKQRRQIADLKRDLAQKLVFIDDLKKELQSKMCECSYSSRSLKLVGLRALSFRTDHRDCHTLKAKMQEELNQAVAEKDASQEEIAAIKLTSERNERQARQEQSRLQSEINSYKMRLERADADLVHARRENLRLAEGIASLEKEINMNKIVEETRVGSQPTRFEKGKEEKDKDKELASLIFDLEHKQEELNQTMLNTDLNSTELINGNFQENNNNQMKNPTYNLILNPQNLEHRPNKENNDERQEGIDSSGYIPQTDAEQNLQQHFVEQQNYGDDNPDQHYNRYNQYDPDQYREYYNNQQYAENQEYSDDQKYFQNEQYPNGEQYVKKENYEEQLPNEKDHGDHPKKYEEK